MRGGEMRALSPASEDRRAAAWRAAARVPDPELPVLTIADLGILRDVEIDEGGAVRVTVLPTYSGCPAMGVIALDVETELAKAGFERASVRIAHSPAWTTAMMSEAARGKLLAYGVAPPAKGAGKRALFGTPDVACPRCGSRETERLSEFGSTACKALWRCASCREPFDHFKCI
jgi:ring-1,2-phenylacetyl-CoA epoxidase subunit PaaD